jgi:hypothetical protein
MILRLVCLLIALSACIRTEAGTLENIDAEKFKNSFNLASNHVRLVALLSPT